MQDVEKLRELLERVEKATGPDRAIDYAIGDKLDPKEWRVCPSYSASLDASIALVERMLPGWAWLALGGLEPKKHMALVGPEGAIDFEAHGSSPALSLLAAMLAALISQAEGEGQRG